VTPDERDKERQDKYVLAAVMFLWGVILTAVSIAIAFGLAFHRR
jgi:hypothetical protein